MTIDEAIELEKREQIKCENDIGLYKRNVCKKHAKQNAEYHRQLAEWLEKLKTVENIMLIYNANWYADEDDGVPDCEVIESIWNVIQDNGLDIDIEQDYRKGKSDGYNKALDDIVIKVKEIVGYDWDWDYYFIGEIAEQLKAGGENDKSI